MDDAPGVASLPMYDIDELTADHDALWGAIRVGLLDRGIEAPRRLTRDADAHTLWHDTRLFMSQACGWPLVHELAGKAQVVGTFEYAVGSAAGARYRSQLVARRDDSVDWRNLSTSTVAVNSFSSLSGWVSLSDAFDGSPRAPRALVESGAHSASIAAVVDGRADLASIDEVTLALLRRWRPAAVEGVEVVGQGPLIPCLPLIARHDTPPDTVAALREAIVDALADPASSAALERLLIVGFHPVDEHHYASLPSPPVTSLARLPLHTSTSTGDPAVQSG